MFIFHFSFSKLFLTVSIHNSIAIVIDVVWLCRCFYKRFLKHRFEIQIHIRTKTRVNTVLTYLWLFLKRTSNSILRPFRRTFFKPDVSHHFTSVARLIRQSSFYNDQYSIRLLTLAAEYLKTQDFQRKKYLTASKCFLEKLTFKLLCGFTFQHFPCQSNKAISQFSII